MQAPVFTTVWLGIKGIRVFGPMARRMIAAAYGMKHEPSRSPHQCVASSREGWDLNQALRVEV